MAVYVSLASFAQHFGHQTTEWHMPMPIESCTKAGGCKSQDRKLVMDSNWRWTHKYGTYTNCFTGSQWNRTFCPDAATCTANCAVDGISEEQWSDTYGVRRATATGVNISLVTHNDGGMNVGARTYLMDSEDTYQKFKLKNREFTFDVDVSQLSCGLNGALYFVEMDADGGKSKYPTNEAGANLGTGYCDAQCPHDLKWINGEANVKDWKPSVGLNEEAHGDKYSTPLLGNGHGRYGTCCAEMDIWEANKMSTQMTTHGCTTQGQYRCQGTECGDGTMRYNGTCDKDGCDLNPFRTGSTGFFGPGSNWTVNSNKPVTVVTQFITADGTDDGDLVEIRRSYVQDGKRIGSPAATKYAGGFASTSDAQCSAQKSAFGEIDDFKPKGGMKAMGDAMSRGMVLVLSLWVDGADRMLWLDSTKPAPPPGQLPAKGAMRGTCPLDSGDPAKLETDAGNAYVVYSNIRIGELDSTVGPAPSPSPPSPKPSGCPGGSLVSCIGLCPATPATAYQACVQSCATRCVTEAPFEEKEVKA